MKPSEREDWIVVRGWSKPFDRSAVEHCSVLQSRDNPLVFLATRFFVAGGVEKDSRKEHRAKDRTEANAILRNPEAFHGRMDL